MPINKENECVHNWYYRWGVDRGQADYRCSKCYKIGSEAVLTNKEQDLVNHPPHYKKHKSGVECIQVTEHFNFNLGNTIKYIWRA